MFSHFKGLAIQVLVGLVAWSLVAAGARAAAWNSWTGTTSTDWNTPTNWDQVHVPNAGDFGASLSGAGAFRPSITADPLSAFQQLYVGNWAAETLTMTAGNLQVNAASNSRVTVGRADGTFSATFNMSGGTLTTYQTYLAGDYTGYNTTGYLNLSGTAVYNNLTPSGIWPTMLVGQNGTGVLTIADNAFLRTGNITLGVTGRGTLNLTGGTLQLDGCPGNGDVTLGMAAGNTNAVFNWGGGTVKMNAPTRSTNPVDYYGRAYGFNVQLNETLTGIGGNAKFDTNGYSVEMSGNMSGVGGLVKLGAGTLNRTGAGSYSGGTTISQGTLQVSNLTAAGTGDITLGDAATGANNYSVQLTITPTGSMANAITVANTGSTSTATIQFPAASTTYLTTGTITLNRATTFTAPIASNYFGLQSNIVGNGQLTIGNTNGLRFGLTNPTPGVYTAAGYTGDIVVQNAGVFEPDGQLTSPTGNSVTVQSGGLLFIVWANESINALNGTGAVSTSPYGGARTLTVGKDNGSGAFSGSMINNTGALSFIKAGSGTEELAGTGITYTGGTTVNAGTLRLTDATGFNSNVAMNGGTLVLNGTGGSWTFGRQITGGSGNVVKTGAGTVILTQGDSYTGGTTISQGTLQLNADTAAGTGPITLGDAGTGNSDVTLTINSWPTNPITVANQGTGSAAIHYIPASANFTVPLGNMTFNRAATFDAPGLLGYMVTNSVLAGNGALTFGSTNGQRVILGGASPSFTGDITIQSNAVIEPRDSLTTANGNNVTVQSGGIMQIVFSNTSINALNGGGTIRGNGFDGGTRILTVGVGGGSGVFSGAMQNNGTNLGLTKAGAGTEELSGAGITYTGATTVNAGTLRLTDATGFNSNVAMNGGTLVLNGTGGSWTVGRQITGGSGNVVKTGAGTVILTQGDSYTGGTTISQGTLQLNADTAAGTGPITLGDAGTGNNNVTLTINSWPTNPITVANQGTGSAAIHYIPASANFTVPLGNMTFNRAATFDAPGLLGYMVTNSVLAGNGALTLGTTNGQRVILGGASPSFTGDITIQSNAVIEPRDSLTTANGNNVTVQPGGIMQIVFSNTSINALNGGGTIRGNGFDTGTRVLTVGVGGGSGLFSGTMQNNGTTLALTKAGAGTETLSGNNTYTGATTINGGKLLIDGSITSPVTVNSGGMLGGKGRVTGAVNVAAGGTVSAGDSPGHLTITGAYNLAGTMLAELGGTTQGVTYDWIEVNGVATLNAGSIVDVNAWNNWPSPGEGIPYYVLTATGGITNNNLSGITFDFSGAPVGPGDWKASIVPYPAGGSNAEALMLEAVPEPATLALLGVAIAGLGGYLRRRRNGTTVQGLR